MPLGRERIAGDEVAVALDERRAAVGAVGRRTLAITDVASIDIGEPLFAGDGPCPHQGLRRSGRTVEHLEGGEEGGEVQRHGGFELVAYPARQGPDFAFAVVEAGDEERGDLHPHVGVVYQVAQGVEHRLEFAAAVAEVEFLGKAFEVDVGRIHRAEEFLPCAGFDVAVGHGHRIEPMLAGEFGAVDGVFGKDDRIVVGEGEPLGAVGERRGHDGFGRAGVVEGGVELLGGRDRPVLAVFAGEVAAGRAEGEHRRAGVEVVERLLLDGIDAKAARSAVGGEYHLAAEIGAHEAGAVLPLAQLAAARAQDALEAPVGQAPVVAGGGVHRTAPVGKGSFHLATV